MYSDIFRVRNDSLLPKRCSLRRDCLQTHRAHSCYCCERAAALRLPFGLVEIRNAVFGYDMADVVAVDHDWGNWHSRLLANLHRVECVNERGNPTFLKGLYGLYHELSTAHDWLVLRNPGQPGVGWVPPAQGGGSHFWAPPKPLPVAQLSPSK